MANAVDNDLGLRSFVKEQIGVRRHGHPTNGRIARTAANMRMQQKEVGQHLDARLNLTRASWRMGSDVIEDRAKIGKGRKGVSKPHRPCLDQTARTCSSVANSPRAAARFETAIASCSSGVSGTGGSSSAPARRRTTRAMSS